MLRIVEDTVRSITPHILGVDAVEELPQADPEDSVEFVSEWLKVGIPEFRILTNIAFLTLNLYSLVRKGRPFPSLDHGTQAELFERLYKRKGMLSYQFLYFLAVPAMGSYCSRIDVQKLLGFDIEGLKEESEKRLVTRDGSSLPPKGSAEESSSAGGAR